MRGRTLRAAIIAAAAIASLVGVQLAAGKSGPSTSAATPTCSFSNGIKHVVYLQFDNTHFNRDNPNVASDLEQMPHLLNFLTQNGTLFTNDHTILISHTAGGILSTLTGLYPDRQGQTVSNSFDYYQNNGIPTFVSSFKYWTDTVDGANDPLSNMIGDGRQTTPAPWLTYTNAGCDVGGVSAANIELENNNAIVVLAGPTSLTADATAGSNTLHVASTSRFAVGQTLNVDADGAVETSTVTAVNPALKTITINPALAQTHTSGTRVYSWITDTSGDMTRVFGAGSAEWNEGRDSQTAPSGTAARAIAQTDFVGIAIHCGVGSPLCTGNPHARPDDATIVPGSNNGHLGLFGAKYVNPAITGGSGCVKATDGTNIGDSFSQCGFPGFDGALAKNTLGEVAQMQEAGVPVTYAYISDAHDNHTLGRASGPGEADYKQQLANYDAAFATFFQRLQNDGIDKSNTLFVVTVDEGDHFAGGVGTPDGSGNLVYNHTACPQAPTATPCPSNQIGEVNVKIGAVLPAGEPAYDIHFDDAPTFYVNGDAAHPNGPSRTDPTVRKLEQDVWNATAPDPYAGGNVPIAQRLADPVEEQTLHMINSDPKRTPTFTLFGNPDFFFQTTNLSGGCSGSTVCVNPGFAWNHGDVQQEIGNTWVGFVGPGVSSGGIDSTTWTDHTNVRPTINALLGVQDSYVDDGRVLIEALTTKATPQTLIAHRETVLRLGNVYEQVNAPFGSFAMDTLKASTAALASTDDATYTSIENTIASLTSQRDALVSQIRAGLNAAAFDGQALNEQQAKGWIDQAQSLIDQAAALAASS
jgi:hypothetical protein